MAPPPSPTAPGLTRAEARPDVLRDQLGDWRLAALLVSTLLMWALLFRFTVVLDVVAPRRAPLIFLLFVLGLVVAGAVIAVAWRVLDRAAHPVWTYVAVSLGALAGLFYALTILPEDFSNVLLFGRLFAYSLFQGLFVFPLTIAVWVVAAFRMWRLPDSTSGVTGALISLPFAFQAGLHGGIVLGAWATLDRLMSLARGYNTPEAPGAGVVVVLTTLVGVAWLRRRRAS